MVFDRLENYRDPARVAALRERIDAAACSLKRPLRLMEVCGGHTMAIHRFGIHTLMPPQLDLISGPGCPVCVTPGAYIDAAVEWGESCDGIVVTFGDLYGVPGSDESLEEAAGRGLDVRIVYSPGDALDIAERHAERKVVFLGVGFETTAPVVAATLGQARSRRQTNFQVMSAHKTMPGALRALVECGDSALDGFILPGHVSAITGAEPYRFLAEDYGVACCITGFEPVDIMQGILSLVLQCGRSEPKVDNRYGRAVRPGGNPRALELLRRTFVAVDSQWRGMGCIEGSGLDLSESWSDYAVPAPDPRLESENDVRCSCGEVLRGVITPPQCPLFASSCTPKTPIGPCMVSSEGSCAAHYRYTL